jgi:hypothetical protein
MNLSVSTATERSGIAGIRDCVSIARREAGRMPIRPLFLFQTKTAGCLTALTKSPGCPGRTTRGSIGMQHGER